MRQVRIIIGRRHWYLTAGRILSTPATRRWQVTRGSGVTLRLFRVRGRFAILLQTFAH